VTRKLPALRSGSVGIQVVIGDFAPDVELPKRTFELCALGIEREDGTVSVTYEVGGERTTRIMQASEVRWL
jgi:hypothetical protein